MNLQKLFEVQAKLDKKIVEEKGLQGQDLLDKKILALQVELGELANCWRGFKFWSHDQEPRIEKRTYKTCPSCDGEYVDSCWECGHSGQVVDKIINPLLEEFVDCLHFILSIAIELGYTVDDLYVWDDELVGKTEDIFLELMYWVVLIKSKDERKRKDAFRTVCYIFFNMAEQRLGFTWEQIEEAYLEKNRINHQRQLNHY
ncbi:dUTP diphosphatase [Ureibacillus thermophilus]|uniref:dUTPase n=1 Tax=Ureibacillus thermophilus TaxID=367743 RepID=A0A4P6UU76_9BACL|nr:dUTP diphosphatase [Ureibacillus thermophilus]QBK26724.1 dUTPase [Ureibacillus thermophilus]